LSYTRDFKDLDSFKGPDGLFPIAVSRCDLISQRAANRQPLSRIATGVDFRSRAQGSTSASTQSAGPARTRSMLRLSHRASLAATTPERLDMKRSTGRLTLAARTLLSARRGSFA